MLIYATRILPLEIKNEFIASGYQVKEWGEQRDLTPEELIEEVAGATAVLSMGKQQFDASFFKACPQLLVLALYSVGYDHVDLQAATANGVAVGNTPGVLSKATADIAFILMQNVARKIFYNHQLIREGRWTSLDNYEGIGQDLQGKTLGILGLGRIGFEMARSAKGAYDMKIIYHNRSINQQAELELGAQRVSFDELLAQSDVLSVHANLTSETQGLFNKKAFEKMKSTALFINTARGAIHNEKDLIAALNHGEIWGAGLDVTNPEPMRADNPLLQMSNTAILPHIGSASFETRKQMMQICLANVLAGLKGLPLPHLVNTDL